MIVGTSRSGPEFIRLSSGCGPVWNYAKGHKGPAQWRPPRQEFWCQYAQAWAAVKHVWELQSTAAERQALREMLATC